MTIVTTVAAMQAVADQARREGRRIAVVPTMGYLHEGHLSLIAEARRRADVVVTTIFVNPTQFGPTEDFARYPRDFERDTVMAEQAGTDVLFHPAAEEMYPAGHSSAVDAGPVGAMLEGAIRPTHFRGVTTVVAKLFNITKPHCAIFGQKDAQQAFLIRRMTRDLNFDVEIIVAPIVREADGLALSSRNVYLSPEERPRATVLVRALQRADTRIKAGERSVDAVRAEMMQQLQTGQPTAVDYIAFLDPETFREIGSLTPPAVLIALAVRFGATRLIDNMRIEITGSHG